MGGGGILQVENGEAVGQAPGPEDWPAESDGQVGLATPGDLKRVDGIKRRCGVGGS